MKICHLGETYIREIKPSDIGVVSGQKNGRVKKKLSYGSFYFIFSERPKIVGDARRNNQKSRPKGTTSGTPLCACSKKTSC
jgi:hypothetical protein